jgi:hypothetical protein
MTPLKEGQQVLIRNPRNVIGTVVRQRPGDRNEPEEKRHYLVKIEEQQLYYLADDLEALPEPSKELRRYSPEWMAELQRFVSAGQRIIADMNDKDASAEFIDAGTKIGWVKPIEK